VSIDLKANESVLDSIVGAAERIRRGELSATSLLDRIVARIGAMNLSGR